MFLTFSDSAKFAQAAFNFLNGNGLSISHSFFSTKLLSTHQSGSLLPANFLPFTPWVLSLFFRFLPPTDQTIALAGWSAFILSVLLVFLITRRLHRFASALIAATLFFFSLPFWEYANNASTEIFFTLEILLVVYLLLTRFKWLALLPLAAIFFTRPQAPIFLASFAITALFFFLASKKSPRMKLIVFAVCLIIGFFFAKFILTKSSFIGSFNLPANVAQGQFLRGQIYTPITLPQLASKIFYHVYNYAKNLDPLASPIVFAFFLLGLFIKRSDLLIRRFNLFTSIILGLFVMAASATLPNARYVHPVIPLVIIAASIALVRQVRPLAIVAVLFLIILPSLGNLTLDARFRRQQFNIDKPPVYRQISHLMAQNISPGRLIITNLDAWAAWYEGLTTMWFPLSPDQLEGYQNKVEYIVITNYKESDADFTLGQWWEVVYSPEKIQNKFLNQNYQLLATFDIHPSDVYENQLYRGTILVRRDPQD